MNFQKSNKYTKKWIENAGKYKEEKMSKSCIVNVFIEYLKI